MTTPSRSRFAGLDGLRAIAVILVVVYHLFPGLRVHSGFLGVDVFFVISGFLITSLLLRERAATGTIALGAFWRRRLRRLVPALAVVVTVCATGAWLIGGDVLVDLGRQLVGAATFSYNWVSILDDASYFAAAQPEIFRNLWSLAVEEQFYLLWPLLLPLFLLLRRRWRVTAALLLGAASAGWAAVALNVADPTRTYYGTDTHAFGLLLGVALAFAVHALPLRRVRPGWGGAVGVLALVGLVAVATPEPTSTVWTFPGALVLTSALTTVIILVAIAPGSWFGRALDIAPLRWVGERSYGIYLWHWPLVVLLTAAVAGTTADAGVPVPVGLAALALTLAAAELSYRFVEQPVRCHGFRGVLRLARAGLSANPSRRFSTVTAVAAIVAVVGGTGAAVVAAPQVTSSEAVVQAGQSALDARGADEPTVRTIANAPLRPGDRGEPPLCIDDVVTAEGGHCTPRDGRPLPPEPTPVDGARVSAIGDSVMLASADGLLERLPGIQVDAKVSRSMHAGPGIVADLAARDRLRDYVVVALGTNGPVSDEALEQLYDAVGRDRALVLVNAYAPRDWIPGVNRDLEEFARSHPGVAIADWAGAIADHTDLLAGDRIHPGHAGGKIFADTVGDVVDDIEQQHATVTYQIELAQWAATKTFGPAARGAAVSAAEGAAGAAGSAAERAATPRH
ncbi:acyltransferase family protein [Microbacterium sp. MC2]